MKQPLFKLGKLYATPGALDEAEARDVDLALLVRRHLVGDWSEMDKHDQLVNAEAVDEGNRVLSAYTVKGVKFWIITEWDRSVTTILLPSEY